MRLESLTYGCITVAVVDDADGLVIRDTPSALDLLMAARYEAGADRIAVAKELVSDDFFVLSTGMAGEILQKYVNYQMKLAVYGDYSHCTSRSLHDFIYESNKGNDFFFVATRDEALSRLVAAR